MECRQHLDLRSLRDINTVALQRKQLLHEECYRAATRANEIATVSGGCTQLYNNAPRPRPRRQQQQRRRRWQQRRYTQIICIQAAPRLETIALYVLYKNRVSFSLPPPLPPRRLYKALNCAQSHTYVAARCANLSKQELNESGSGSG